MTLPVNEDRLKSLIDSFIPGTEAASVVGALNDLMPELEWRRVMTRSHWHRLGGVVDKDYQRVADNLREWVEAIGGEDVDDLIAQYADLDYFATRLAGKTHYFTAPCSDSPADFLQLEVEELQEVVDRPLIEPDYYPDSLEEFLDPVEYTHAEPVPIGEARLAFRRISSIAQLIQQAGEESQVQPNLNLVRFLLDWQQSSAFEGQHLCRHWVMTINSYKDRDGEDKLILRPKSVHEGDIPDKDSSVHGSELAVYIHTYDRHMGYPFAWYFHLLGQKSAHQDIIDKVLKDQLGAYDYLPARDVKILRKWEERPYAV